MPALAVDFWAGKKICQHEWTPIETEQGWCPGLSPSQDTLGRMRKEEAKHTGFIGNPAPYPLRLFEIASNLQSQTLEKSHRFLKNDVNSQGLYSLVISLGSWFLPHVWSHLFLQVLQKLNHAKYLFNRCYRRLAVLGQGKDEGSVCTEVMYVHLNSNLKILFYRFLTDI